MELKDKLSPDLPNFISSTPKNAKVPLIIQTVDGLTEEDKALVYSHQGTIGDELPSIKAYEAQLPADMSIIEEVARDERVTYILPNYKTPGPVRVFIEYYSLRLLHTVKGLTEEEKTLIYSNAGEILKEFKSIKSYIVWLPSRVEAELERTDSELTFARNIDLTNISLSDLIKGAKVISSFSDLKMEFEENRSYQEEQ